MDKPLEELARATRLTREGKLGAATAAIRRALKGLRWRMPQPVPAGGPMERDADVIDVPLRESPRHAPEPASATHGTFEAHEFAFGGQRYRYRLYLPASAATRRPVVVMLHGCKQDAADFARGTGMNPLAERDGCIVIYPEQVRSANSMGCWNWFLPAHQQREDGEPGMIAALSREIVARHDGDPRRVYVAGLSAGGAMAALVAQLHPDLFAAVGVHSGLAPAMADDLYSAFSAMRKGHRKTPAGDAATRAIVPTIAFQGSADTTVHPSNADRIADETLEAWVARGAALKATREKIPGTRDATRTVYAARDGSTPLEVWEIASGPHAWSGGNREGSFTDPGAPSASKAMLAFFLRQRRR